MFTHRTPINLVSSRRFFPIVVPTMVIAAMSTMAIIAGCGGGGGGGGSTSTPTPTPTPTPTVSPSPTETPKQRAIAANFLPNYIWSASNSTPYIHWEDNKHIRVFIRPTATNIRDNSSSSALSAAQAKSYVDQAIANWSTTTGNDFAFQYVNNASDADIEVVFVDQLMHSDLSVATGIVGLTNYSYTNPNSSDLNHGLLKKSVMQVLDKQDGGDPNLIDTTTHELGHSIGILLHSPDNADLMFTTSLPPPTITQRDQNTVFFLYYSNSGLGKAEKIPGASSKVHYGEIDCDPTVAH